MNRSFRVKLRLTCKTTHFALIDNSLGMYAKRIDHLRKLVALFVIILGVGMAAGIQFQHQRLLVWCSFGFLLCILITIGLGLEYLIRTWLQRRKSGRLTRAQFSLTGMMLFTLYVAITCAILRLIGLPYFIVAIVLGVIVVAVGMAPVLEMMNRSDNDANQ